LPSFDPRTVKEDWGGGERGSRFLAAYQVKGYKQLCPGGLHFRTCLGYRPGSSCCQG
jgi:hypothetical protein